MEISKNGQVKDAPNKQGEGKVSKTGRKRKYQIKGEMGNASNKHGGIHLMKGRGIILSYNKCTNNSNFFIGIILSQF